MNRDSQIDIAKGLAIFFVVAGHILSKDTLSWKITYIFHMPFFFLVSGYFHKLDIQEIKYCKQKAISLLIPYLSYLLIFSIPILFNLLFSLIQEPSKDNILSVIQFLFKLLYGGQKLTGDFTVFWFITCLFLSGQLFNYIGIRVKNIKVMGVIVGLFYLMAYYNQKYPSIIIPPWSANVVLFSFLFYFIGSIYGKYIFRNTHKIVSWISIIICVSSLILISRGYRLNLDMKYLNYGYFILSPLLAIAWTKLLMILSSLLDKQSYIKPILVFSGTASITIMFWHYFLIGYLPYLGISYPWLAIFIVWGVCCIIHFILQKNILSRAFLLGSRKDFVKLF